MNSCWSNVSWFSLDRCTARAVLLVHVAALQCPGMLPDTNLLTQKQPMTLVPLYFSPSFLPKEWWSPKSSCLLLRWLLDPNNSPPWQSNAVIFGAALLDTFSNTARVSYPFRDPARVLMHPLARQEALALSMLSLAIMNHMTQGKLFNIPSQMVVSSACLQNSLFSR